MVESLDPYFARYWYHQKTPYHHRKESVPAQPGLCIIIHLKIVTLVYPEYPIPYVDEADNNAWYEELYGEAQGGVRQPVVGKLPVLGREYTIVHITIIAL